MDLDGTLCDCSHRVHWAQAKQWEQFHAGIQEDKPHNEAMEFLRAIAPTHEILVCTGRDERHRAATERWLTEQGIAPLIHCVLMRPDNDRSSDHELKVKMVVDHFGGASEAQASVLLVLDDRDKVVEAWRNAGFRCWQVSVGNY